MSGAEPGVLVEIDLAEEIQRRQPPPGTIDQDAVVGIAFRYMQLAADHVIEGTEVADDVDALDIDAWPFLDIEDQIESFLGRIAGDLRIDAGKGIARLAGLQGHVLDRLVDLAGVISLAWSDVEDTLQPVGVKFGVTGVDADLTERILRPLIDGEGNEEALTVAGEFGGRRDHLEIGIAVLEIEPPQQFAIVSQPIRIVVVGGGKELPPGQFRRRDGRTQRAIRKGLVANEIDARDLGRLALVDDEDEVHAVLRKTDDLGIDPCGKMSGSAIERNQPLHVGLDPRAGIDHALLQFDFLGELLVVEIGIAFEADLVNERVFRDLYDQAAAPSENPHIGEKPRLKQSLDRFIDLRGCDGLTRRHMHVGEDGVALHALIAFHDDLVHRLCLHRRNRLQQKGQGNDKTQRQDDTPHQNR